jgi:hypothetical protein
MVGYVEAFHPANQRVAAGPGADAVGAGREQLELSVDAVQGEIHEASKGSIKPPCYKHPKVQKRRYAALQQM